MNGWVSKYNEKSIDSMLDIASKQILESHGTALLLSAKDRQKIYKVIKRDNSLNNIETEEILESINEIDEKTDRKENDNLDYLEYFRKINGIQKEI